MGEVAMPAPGILSKISSLFNNPLYSDVEFAFGPDRDSKIYCHRLVLALRSKAFSHMFFENDNPLPVVRLPASKKALFNLLLKFLYTDEVNFNTFDEAQDLLVLADEFDVEELVVKCHNYIAQNKLTINNVFSRYESALKNNIEVLLMDCRNFACSNFQKIISSNSFAKASLNVAEDIIKQDNLCVANELEVIEAVLTWGMAHSRQDILFDEKLLRACINPLMKYLRILTLSSSEFEYLVENYNIFTSYESVVLTRKILQPESDVKVPDDFCNTIVKRSMVKPKSSNVESSVQSNKPELVKSNVSKSVNFKLPDFTSDSKLSYEVKKCKSELSKSSDPESLRQMNIAHEVRRSVLQESKQLPTHFRQNKFKSSSSMEKVILASSQGISQTRLRSYEFCLQENDASFKLSFQNDLTNSITFKMKSGNLYLYGLELKVKSKNISPEILEADVYLKGFSKEPFHQKFKRELKNDVLIIKFPEGMRLRERSQGELEVSIDNLYLNRYYACAASGPFELNNGLNFACEFSIESNKKDDNGNLFLISKLIYVPS